MVVEEAGGSGADVMWFEPGVVLKDVKSSVWGVFKFKGTQIKGPNKEKVYCTICATNKKTSAKVSYSGGTSNLSSHLKNYHPDEYSKKEEEKRIQRGRKESCVLILMYMMLIMMTTK